MSPSQSENLMSENLLQGFAALYADINPTSVEGLARLYADDVIFIDPVGKHYGLDNLKGYFTSLFENCDYCHFHVERRFVAGDQAGVEWLMLFQNKRLKGGQPISVSGFSALTIENGRIIRQRDFFDMGALVYEHVPLLGRIIRFLRKRMAPKAFTEPVHPQKRALPAHPAAKKRMAA